PTITRNRDRLRKSRLRASSSPARTSLGKKSDIPQPPRRMDSLAANLSWIKLRFGDSSDSCKFLCRAGRLNMQEEQ
ncbi:MAG: hypothetical protein KDE02_08780, partial [Rhodobacteraceae bacterium]|nr:hypothetical protein [Paracoccaceae bacterium]